MRYIIYCAGIDFYVRVSDNSECQDYEQSISFSDGCQLDALSELSPASPDLLNYLDWEDLIF